MQYNVKLRRNNLIVCPHYVMCNGIQSQHLNSVTSGYSIYMNYSSHPCGQHEHAIYQLGFPGEGFIHIMWCTQVMQ